MKKVLSCLLAAIIALSCLTIAVSANPTDGYTKSYVVTVAPNFRSMIRITSLEEKDLPEEERTYSYYVKEGDSISFTLEVGGGYRLDQSTVIKYASATKQPDMFKNGEFDNSEYDNGTIIYPDANGVYTIPEITEDTYIYTGLLNKKSISTVKDFLMNLFGFFRDLMMWFFGLK